MTNRDMPVGSLVRLNAPYGTGCGVVLGVRFPYQAFGAEKWDTLFLLTRGSVKRVYRFMVRKI